MTTLQDLPAAPSRTSRRRRKLGAAAASIVLHAALVAALLGSASGAVRFRTAPAGGEADAVVISLAGLRGGGHPTAAAHPAPSALDRMMKRLQAEIPADASRPRPSEADRADRRADLDQLAGKDQGPGAGKGQTERGGTGASEAANDSSVARRAGASRANGADSGAAGSLWAQVEPCWLKGGGRGSLPVTLIVRLNAQGTLVSAPTIVRPTGAALGADRYVAELRAIQAVASCLPYKAGHSSAGGAFRLDFPGS